MQANLLFLLLIFLINLSYNNAQSISCYNCTTCTTSSPGTILSGCTSCATIVYSTRTEKMCASLCSPGSYQGGYLSCCNTNNCNYNTPNSSSYISCYECSTCFSSSPGSITYGCTACATIVYSTRTEKTCSSYCSPGSYQGGDLYCCTTDYCNYKTPRGSSTISCYECSTCSSSFPGSITYGCTACATTVYSSYTEKSCLSSCSPGSYQGGYRYCCNTNNCNNIPTFPYISCYECSTCSSSFPGSITAGCTECATTVYSTRTEKTCSSYCSPGSYQGGYRYCCNTNNCNYNTPNSSSYISCYECSSCPSSSPGSITAGCTACAKVAYSSYSGDAQRRCTSRCTPESFLATSLSCCNTNLCNYGDRISIYKTSFISLPLFVIGLLIC